MRLSGTTLLKRPVKTVGDNYLLWKLVRDEMKLLGYDADLNHLDVSNVTNMYSLFCSTHFKGDISRWDVSNVEVMNDMFVFTEFDGDISMWDTKNLMYANKMFFKSDFDGDISKWDVRNLKEATLMFAYSKFDRDLSEWKLDSITDMSGMFSYSRMSHSIEHFLKYLRPNTEVSNILLGAECYANPKMVFEKRVKMLCEEKTKEDENK